MTMITMYIVHCSLHNTLHVVHITNKHNITRKCAITESTEQGTLTGLDWHKLQCTSTLYSVHNR